MSQCDSYATYLSMMRLTTNLRLVCRSWNLTIRQFQSLKLVVLDLFGLEAAPRPKHVLYLPSAEVLPCAERLETGFTDCAYWGHLHTKCKFGSFCRYNLKLATFGFKMSNINGILTGRLRPPTSIYQPGDRVSNVQVLVIRELFLKESLRSLLNFTTSIKALELSTPRVEPLLNTIHHYVFRRITHLKLDVFQKDIHSMKRQAWFPHVRYLHLTISDTYANAEPFHDITISNWGSFPRLLFLHLCCTIPGELVGDIYGFIEHCGSKLSDLVLQVNVKNPVRHSADPLGIVPHLYICAPKLLRFGSSIGTFLQSPLPPPSTFLPINIILTPIASSLEVAGMRVDYFITSFVKVCRRWHTREVRFLQSWRDLKLSITGMVVFRASGMDMRAIGMPWIDESRNPYACSRFYDAIMECGIIIRDCDGISITETSGRELLTARRQSEMQKPIDETTKLDPPGIYHMTTSTQRSYHKARPRANSRFYETLASFGDNATRGGSTSDPRKQEGLLETTGSGLGIGDHLVFSDHGVRCWPTPLKVPLNRLRRIEFQSITMCLCEEICPMGIHWTKAACPEYSRDSPIENIRVYSSLPHLRVLIFGVEGFDSVLYFDIMSKATSLKALLIQGSELLRYSNLKDPIFPAPIHLTHLALTAMTPDLLYQLAYKTCLPHMRLLDVEFKRSRIRWVDTPEDRQIEQLTPTKKFPDLRSLILSGFVEESSRRVLEQLVNRFSSSVTEFSDVDLRYGMHDSPLNLHIRDSFPQIRIYGVSFAKAIAFAEQQTFGALKKEHIPSSQEHLAILLKNFELRSQYIGSIISDAELFLQLCRSMACTRIFLENSWDEYTTEREDIRKQKDTHAKVTERLMGLFLTGLVRRGIAIYDRESVPFVVNVTVYRKVLNSQHKTDIYPHEEAENDTKFRRDGFIKTLISSLLLDYVTCYAIHQSSYGHKMSYRSSKEICRFVKVVRSKKLGYLRARRQTRINLVLASSHTLIMNKPVTSTVPVEIWREVFIYALDTKNLPQGSSEGQFEMLRNSRLFWRECYSGKKYLRSERIRTSLRLVCKTWNVELEPMGAGSIIGDHLMLSRNEIHHYPNPPTVPLNKLRRIEFQNAELCMCEERCPIGVHWAYTLRHGHSRHNDFEVYESLPHLRVLIFDTGYFNRLGFFDILRKAILLGALLIKGEFSDADLRYQWSELLSINHKALSTVIKKSFVSLVPEMDIPNSQEPLAILLKNFKLRGQLLSPVISEAKLFLQFCHTIGCRKVFFENSWKEYEEEWRDMSFRDRHTKVTEIRGGVFISGLVRRGIGIYDRNAVPFKVEAEMYREVLKDEPGVETRETFERWLSGTD
ncbi:hypothetical protein M408DRAFT_317359 [Serendipita vermifera MAFF 305830]|uniref:Uncharacterized protein n=1 Tax=Serendipita vermifera MAFF 305830 TaxID=933852 RepID=A0A0C3AZG1_SERVB|nr:hypothetical protein M408DRAFT_317359 [Serendipita vermifera MAFF 305830]